MNLIFGGGKWEGGLEDDNEIEAEKGELHRKPHIASSWGLRTALVRDM